jgi:hypothetical protein
MNQAYIRDLTPEGMMALLSPITAQGKFKEILS